MTKKKKSITKKWWSRTFGDKFNIWDVIILAIIVGYGTYIYITGGWITLAELVGDSLFYALVISFVANQLIKRARK